MITVKLDVNLATLGGVSGKTPVVKTQFNEPREQLNPGELLCASLGACMLTMIGFVASRKGENVLGTQVHITPSFDDKHSRILAFAVTLEFPPTLTAEQKNFYAKAAETCPVHNSLRADIDYKITVK